MEKLTENMIRWAESKLGSTAYEEMEALLSNAGFLIYEHMDADEATDAFLKESGMTAPAGVGYCLAVRK